MKTALVYTTAESGADSTNRKMYDRPGVLLSSYPNGLLLSTQKS
jgi:hypothetical protein